MARRTTRRCRRRRSSRIAAGQHRDRGAHYVERQCHGAGIVHSCPAAAHRVATVSTATACSDCIKPQLLARRCC
jgi:hypothetical protein